MQTKADRPWLVLILAAMVALRAALLAADAFPFNGDEAIVGLMARHLLQGERPAFFYGQAYLGSTDAWLVALSFSIFGQSVLAIRIAQVALFAATLVTTHLVARRLGLGAVSARLAVLFMALPPAMLTLYTTATLGGYGETLLLGNILILIALGLDHQGTESAGTVKALSVLRVSVADLHRLLRWLAFGFVAGFAFWTFGLILVYLIPLAAWLLAKHRLRAWRGYALALIGFAIGGAPWWTAIGQLGGSLIGELAGSAVANTVAAPAALDSLGVRLINFFAFGASAWLGLRYPWSPEFVLPAVGLVVAGLYLAAFVLAARRGARLLWGMLGVLLATYLLTPFGGDPSGRYFVPLYLPLSIFAAQCVGQFHGRRRGLVGLLAGLIVGYNVVGTALAVTQPHGITTQFDAVTWIERGRERELIDFLLRQGETRVYANYWVAYPMAFLSRERVIASARLPYHLDFRYTRRDDRYPPYPRAVDESPRAAYVTTNHPALDRLIRERLSGLGVTFREETIGDYHVFYALSRKVAPQDIGLGETTN